MITNSISFVPSLSYPLSRLAPEGQTLFFDIETTGFSPSSSSLYLIGCAAQDSSGVWKLTQWFADHLSDEAEMLRSFFRYASRYRSLVHFNGEGFDLPYLKNCCAQYHMEYGLEGLESIDLFRLLRPCKQFLGMSSMKLKSCEEYLGIRRRDPFTGGQLIAVYEEYQKTRDTRLLKALLLHNEEDVKGLFPLLSLLSYRDCRQTPPVLLSAEESPDKKSLILTAELSADLPAPLSRAVRFPGQEICAALSLDGKRLVCRVPFYEGELKYFYPDYQEYYYLPEEDTAIHRLVAEYVDKSRRRKASASTCYTRKSGRFLPQAEPVFSPAFRKEYRSKTAFFLWEDAKNRPDLLQNYLESLFTGSEAAT